MGVRNRGAFLGGTATFAVDGSLLIVDEGADEGGSQGAEVGVGGQAAEDGGSLVGLEEAVGRPDLGQERLLPGLGQPKFLW